MCIITKPGGVDEKLTDIQHDYLDTIVSTPHIHLTRDKCMLIIIVRGDSSRVYNLLKDFINTRGVLLVKSMILEAENETNNR